MRNAEVTGADLSDEVARGSKAHGRLWRFRESWRRERRYLRLVAVIGYFVIWFGVTEDGLALIPPLFFPSPRLVVMALFNFWDILAGDIAITMLRMLVGWSVGVFLGVSFGLWMYFSKSAYHFFDPLIETIRPVPPIAMVPFFILWFGLAEQGKFLLVALGVFTVVVVTTLETARSLPRIYSRAARSLGASTWQLLRYIVLPGIVPGLVGVLRVTTALAFTLVVAAEFMGAQAGLGFRISQARRLFSTDVVLLGVILFGVMSSAVDYIARRAFAYLTRWSERGLS
jgi:ABC-type nitrate/sulfonate/bicarbonate transport system permease component